MPRPRREADAALDEAAAAASESEATAGAGGARPRQAAMAQAQIGVALSRLQLDHGLTDIEMLQAVSSWQQSCLRYILRAGRHPGDPGEPAEAE